MKRDLLTKGTGNHMTVNHSCPYCGQMQILILGDDKFTEHEKDDLAAKQCDCDEARAYQNKEDIETYACADIRDVCEEDSESFRQGLLDLVPYLGVCDYDKVTVAKGGVRVTLTRKDASIKVERSKTEKKVKG